MPTVPSPAAASRRVGAVAGLLTGRLTDAGFAAGWSLVRGLPEPAAQALFRAGADLAAVRGGPGVERLRGNLRRVVEHGGAPASDLEGLVREALRSYARYWCEAFRLPVTSAERLRRDTVLVDPPGRLMSAARERNGVIYALPHTGNWDAAGAWFVANGFGFTTVAERLKPESLYDRFVAFRESLGMEVLPLTGGRPPFDVAVERLEAGGLLCLLADRDLSARGVPVRFFGAATRMPAGPANLALRTGAVLLPVTLSFVPGGWQIEVHPEVAHSDVMTMTQDLARSFECGIAAHPADWHMLQKLWLEDLAPGDPRREQA